MYVRANLVHELLHHVLHNLNSVDSVYRSRVRVYAFPFFYNNNNNNIQVMLLLLLPLPLALPSILSSSFSSYRFCFLCAFLLLCSCWIFLFNTQTEFALSQLCKHVCGPFSLIQLFFFCFSQCFLLFIYFSSLDFCFLQVCFPLLAGFLF